MGGVTGPCQAKQMTAGRLGGRRAQADSEELAAGRPGGARRPLGVAPKAGTKGHVVRMLTRQPNRRRNSRAPELTRIVVALNDEQWIVAREPIPDHDDLFVFVVTRVYEDGLVRADGSGGLEPTVGVARELLTGNHHRDVGRATTGVVVDLAV